MDWDQYQLLDSGDGRKLERFGKYILDRPDPQIIWKKEFPEIWDQSNAVFDGNWKNKTAMPNEWGMEWKDIKFTAKLTPFKHTGIFPEQEWQWTFINDQCQMSNDKLHVLNLFGYTGMASLVAANSGAKVTYVDASKSALTWARNNQQLSGISDAPIRWILDDVLKFVTREVRRGTKYDCIIMDPPAYGHGPEGETWQFYKSLPELASLCRNLLSDSPKFVLINAYAISTSSHTLANVLYDLMKGNAGEIKSGELVLKSPSSNKILTTGIWGSWCASIK
jgi:23S rRNA (cytosine1962-C5)-methyltransferase